MCGIIAQLSSEAFADSNHVSTELYEGLGLLQHRGQVRCNAELCSIVGRGWHCDMWSQRKAISM